jgi:hypothetical protein
VDCLIKYSSNLNHKKGTIHVKAARDVLLKFSGGTEEVGSEFWNYANQFGPLFKDYILSKVLFSRGYYDSFEDSIKASFLPPALNMLDKYLLILKRGSKLEIADYFDSIHNIAEFLSKSNWEPLDYFNHFIVPIRNKWDIEFAAGWNN